MAGLGVVEAHEKLLPEMSRASLDIIDVCRSFITAVWMRRVATEANASEKVQVELAPHIDDVELPYFVDVSPPTTEATPGVTSAARALQADAMSYLQAAQKLMFGEPDYVGVTYRMPLNFMLGHACELGLKASLAMRGYTEAQLVQLGHDLRKIISKCKTEGVVIDPEFERYCKMMGSPHRRLLFRYPIESAPWIGHEQAFAMIEPQLRAALA